MWSKKGQIFVLLGVVSLFGGLVASNILLVILGFLLLGMVIISAMFRLSNEIVAIRRGAKELGEKTYKGVKFTRRLSSYQMFEGSKVAVRLYMENTARGAKRFEILDKLPDTVALAGGANTVVATVPSRSGSMMDYIIDTPIKGFYKAGPLRIRETDLCRFFYDELTLDNTTEFKVYPNVFEVKEMSVKSKLPKLYAGTTIINKPGQGMEFYAIRDYVPGESYRDINWPAFARTRKLMVNEHEMEAVIELTMILDYRAVTRTGRVVSNVHLATARAAASLATYFVKRRDKVGVAIYNSDVTYVHRDGGAKHLNRLLNHITGEPVKGSVPLSGVVNTISKDIVKGMPIVVVSSLEDDDTVYDGLKRLRAHGCDVTLISPTGLKQERAAAKDEATRHMLTVLEQERKAEIRLIRSLGVIVYDWDISMPFNTVLAAGSRRRGRR